MTLKDRYVLLKNGISISETAFDPRYAAPVLVETPGYDARDPKYQVRGDGKADWEAAGRPPFDVKGRELDPAGYPTGRMKDGSSEDGGSPAPANTDPLAGAVVVELHGPDDKASVPFSVSTPGKFYVETGEAPEQDWSLKFNGAEILSGNGPMSTEQAFPLDVGSGSIDVSVNKEAIGNVVLNEKIMANNGISRTHYTLRRVA